MKERMRNNIVLTLSLETTLKKRQLQRTMILKHWKSGNKRQQSLREGNK